MAALEPPKFHLEGPARSRLQLAVRRWCQERALKVALRAEQPGLKRANIISTELKRQIMYQFAIESKSPFARDASVTFIGDPR